MASARRSLGKLREVGWRYFAVTVFERIVPGFVFRLSRFRVLEIRLRAGERAARECPDARWATARDAQLLGRFGHSLDRVEERLRGGDRAFMIERRGLLSAYLWLRTTSHLEEDVGLEFQLEPGETWLYDAMVAVEERGTGLYPKLLRDAARELAGEGFDRLLIAVEKLNRNSLRAHLRAGASEIGGVECARVLGFVCARIGSRWRFARPGRGPVEVATRELRRAGGRLEPGA